MANPKIVDMTTYTQFYKNVLPPKMGEKGPALNMEILKSLRIIDEQDHINRGKWFEVPQYLSQQLIERILYYKGRAALFYWNERFFFLPFAPVGSLDCYGRYRKITPLPFNGSAEDKDAKPLLEGLEFEVAYDIIMPEDLTLEDLTNKAVIFYDYSPQLSQHCIPRSQLQEPLMQVMSECIPFMRTSLINSTGIDGIKIQSQDEASAVLQASNATVNAALNGDKWVPMQGGLEVEALSKSSNTAHSEEFLLALQSLDNLRLSMHGLDNGGIFQKKSHMLEAEQEMNQGQANLVLQDAIMNRQMSCTIANSIWGLGLWYEPSESTLGADLNMDGMIYDDYSDNTTHNEDLAMMSGESEDNA